MSALARTRRPTYEGVMGRQATVALWVIAMVVVVVAMDLLFFRNHFWERLAANVGMVLLFGAFFLRFVKHR